MSAQVAKSNPCPPPFTSATSVTLKLAISWLLPIAGEKGICRRAGQPPLDAEQKSRRSNGYQEIQPSEGAPEPSRIQQKEVRTAEVA